MLLVPMVHDRGSTVAERITAVGYDFAEQPKERPAGCNLCGSRRLVEMSRRDRYGYSATSALCVRCGLGYLDPRLSAAAYADFYSRVYRPLVSAYHGRRIDTATVQADQRIYAAELVEFLGPLLPYPPATVLDVGGSTGVVAGVVCAGLGGRATVLDPAPDELAVAEASGMEIIAGFAEDFDPGDRSWDVVLLCQTIDHLLDVRRTLLALRKLTASSGRAFVDILDIELVLARTGSIEDAIKIDHPYYLTGATAAAFFALVGYTVVAQRVSDDGHRGFVLAPGQPADPDWPALELLAAAFLANLRALGASGRT